MLRNITGRLNKVVVLNDTSGRTQHFGNMGNIILSAMDLWMTRNIILPYDVSYAI